MLSPDDPSPTTRYLVPLPKQIEIEGKVSLTANRVGVAGDPRADLLVQYAVRELRECLGQDADASPRTSATFTITFQKGGPDSKELGELANADQAYRIIPKRHNAGLRLVALEPRGLYYAAKTLQQLIRAKKRGNRAVTIRACTSWQPGSRWPNLRARTRN